MIVEILYKDYKKWESVTGEVIEWGNYSKKYKEERVQPYYVAPEIIPDVWNGKQFTAQLTKWDSYYIEFFIKESELHDISRIKSCSDIKIVEYNRDANGLIVTKSLLPDLTSIDYFQVNEPTRQEGSSGWHVEIIFRTNRTVINKADPINNTNEIKLSTSAWEYISSSTAPLGTNYFAKLSSTRLAVINDGILQTYDLTLNQWSAVGNTLATPYISGEGIAIVGLDNNTIAIFADTVDELSTYRYDGSDWTLLGNIKTLASSKTSPVIAKNDTMEVAIMDSEDKKLETYAFDGLDWAQVGNSLSITIATSGTISMSGLDTDLIVYTDSVNSELRTYSFDGTDWTEDYATAVTVGDNVLVASLSSNEIAYIDSDNFLLKKYVTSGSAWSQLNSTYTLSSDQYNAITSIDTETIVGGIIDYGNEWQLIGSTATSYSGNVLLATLFSTRIATVDPDDGAGAVIQAYDYNSSLNVWNTLGNSLKTNLSSSDHAVVALSTSRIVIITGSFAINKIAAYDFDGVNWTLTGNQYTISTTVEPAIAKLGAAKIAILRGTTPRYIEALDFDGTNWTPDGSALSTSVSSSANVSMTGLTSSTIAFIDDISKTLRTYSFSTPTWVQSYATAIPISGNMHISSLSSTVIALLDSSASELKTYVTSGSAWSQGLEAFSVSTNKWSSITALNSINIVGFETNSYNLKNYNIALNNYNSLNNYINGAYNYFTDFDVVNANLEGENVYVDWYDGSKKLYQTINKSGLMVVSYLNAQDTDTFMTRYKASGSMAINGIPISEVTYEIEIIGEDYYRIILSGVSATTASTLDITPNNTYLMAINDGVTTYNYYTDYPPEYISETPIIDTTINQTGINTKVKSISKSVKEARFYLNESDAFSLKLRFELFGTVTLAGVAVKEPREVNPEKLGVDIYEIKINCLLDATSS